MRKFLFLFSTIFIIGACGTKKIIEARPTPPIIKPKLLMNEIDSVSYAFGLFTAQNFQQVQKKSFGKYTLDVDHFYEGFREMLDGSERFSKQEQKDILRAFERNLDAVEIEDEMAGEWKKAQLRTLVINKSKKGVKTTASGLQYKVIKEGNGASPKLTNSVTVHYELRLLDGRVIENSKDRGVPATFLLNRVIPGFTEALQLMKIGSTYEFYIPPSLAFGYAGTPTIPGGAVLKYEVELLGIK
jgi:FKBP-type peptidyl-prolyl cis-trans isomerase